MTLYSHKREAHDGLRRRRSRRERQFLVASIFLGIIVSAAGLIVPSQRQRIYNARASSTSLSTFSLRDIGDMFFSFTDNGAVVKTKSTPSVPKLHVAIKRDFRQQSNHNNRTSPQNEDNNEVVVNGSSMGNTFNATKNQTQPLQDNTTTPRNVTNTANNNSKTSSTTKSMSFANSIKQAFSQEEDERQTPSSYTNNMLKNYKFPSFGSFVWPSATKNVTALGAVVFPATAAPAQDSVSRAATLAPMNLTAMFSKDPTDTLTVADMEEILLEYAKRLQAAKVVDASLRQQQQERQQQDFLKQLPQQQQRQLLPNNKGGDKKNQPILQGLRDEEDEEDRLAGNIGASSVKTKSGVVAFPQPSVLNYKTLKRGTAVAGVFFGMLAATTILPNLWLMGCIFGGIYGYDIVSKVEEQHYDDDRKPNRIARFLMTCGRKLSKYWLQVYDYWQTLWFLYKTGQLSYEYYKTYENLDQRFGIQSKMDAWNARFQEGKIKFDTWEKDNEIGRTVLAGLRTVWLVDEQSKRRAKESSRYRVVQYLYDIKYWVVRWLRKIKNFALGITNTRWYREFLKGVGMDMKESGWDALGTRVGAIVAALVAVNITGALFAISPFFLTLTAVSVGLIWPSWVSELVLRLQELGDETIARGRGEEILTTARSKIKVPNAGAANGKKINTARLLGRYDKQKYHYFKRPDGSKRYYRTGQSMFARKQKDDDDIIKTLFPWLNTQQQKGRKNNNNNNNKRIRNRGRATSRT